MQNALRKFSRELSFSHPNNSSWLKFKKSDEKEREMPDVKTKEKNWRGRVGEWGRGRKIIKHEDNHRINRRQGYGWQEKLWRADTVKKKNLDCDQDLIND